MPAAHHMDNLPELAEADSPPHIRQIYSEIRKWTGGPIVALIFRNLATTPGVLEEVWDAIGPVFRAGRIQEAAWRVARETAPSGMMPPVEASAQVAIGLGGPAIDQLCNLFDAYNRANPVNLLSMLSLLERMKSDAPASLLSSAHWTPPTAIPGGLPMMTPLTALSPDLRRLINDFGFGDRSHIDPVVPSLYRHLTGWPGYLAVMHVTLVPHFRDGSIARATKHVQQAMKTESEAIAHHLPPLRRLPAAPHVKATLVHFTTTVIPQMIVIGHVLRSALR